MSSPELPGSTARRPRSKQELDLLHRNKKKVRKSRDANKGFSGSSSMVPKEEDWMQEKEKVAEEGFKKKTYLVSLMGEEILISQNEDSSDDSGDECIGKEKSKKKMSRDTWWKTI